MSKKAKRWEAIRTNPKEVRFADACAVAEELGFTSKGTRGSHNAYARSGEPQLLNFQNRDGKINVYQARQLIAMMDKYESEQ
jgi:hypothetical protein